MSSTTELEDHAADEAHRGAIAHRLRDDVVSSLTKEEMAVWLSVILFFWYSAGAGWETAEESGRAGESWTPSGERQGR